MNASSFIGFKILLDIVPSALELVNGLVFVVFASLSASFAAEYSPVMSANLLSNVPFALTFESFELEFTSSVLSLEVELFVDDEDESLLVLLFEFSLLVLVVVFELALSLVWLVSSVALLLSSTCFCWSLSCKLLSTCDLAKSSTRVTS